jgi:hypothetical protein
MPKHFFFLAPKHIRMYFSASQCYIDFPLDFPALSDEAGRLCCRLHKSHHLPSTECKEENGENRNTHKMNDQKSRYPSYCWHQKENFAENLAWILHKKKS